jgi:hypothetical protein
MREHYPPCPPNTIQIRRVWSQTYGMEKMLWRTVHCAPDRWHYEHRDCNCAWSPLGLYQPGRSYFRSRGYTYEWVRPERGTWHRDWRGAEAKTRAFRAEIKARREAEAQAAAAIGPQPLKTKWQVYEDPWPFPSVEARKFNEQLAETYYRHALARYMDSWLIDTGLTVYLDRDL